MKREQRRASIVHHAIHLFAQNGFRGTTTRELAKAVGVTEPVLYYHFKTKRELYAAIIETKATEGFEETIALLQPFIDTNDDFGFFAHLAESILNRYAQDPTFVRLLLFSALEGHELAEMFYQRQLTGITRKMIIDYLRRRTKQGAFRPMNSALVARAFVGMIHHHGLLKIFFQDKAVRGSRASFARDVTRLFLEGICQKGNPA